MLGPSEEKKRKEKRKRGRRRRSSCLHPVAQEDERDSVDLQRAEDRPDLEDDPAKSKKSKNIEDPEVYIHQRRSAVVSRLSLEEDKRA